jgi:hypothetical protein
MGTRLSCSSWQTSIPKAALEEGYDKIVELLFGKGMLRPEGYSETSLRKAQNYSHLP